MNLKNIRSKSALFIFIVGFLIGFQAIFGKENSLIGVSTITAMLMLLQVDLSSNIKGYTAKLIVFNLGIGILAYFANLNMWIAIPIHFVAMFIISYSLLYNVRSPLFLPFSLQYLFLCTVPVPVEAMPMRLGALFVGALLIMLIQVIANKNKVSKGSNKLFKELSILLQKRIDLIIEGEKNSEIDNDIYNALTALRNMLYDKRKDSFYLSEQNSNALTMSTCFEKMNLLLHQNSIEDITFLQDIRYLLNELVQHFEKNNNDEALHNAFSQLLRNYREFANKSLFHFNMLNNIYSMKDAIFEQQSEHHKVRSSNVVLEIPAQYKKANIGRNAAHTNKVKLSYAVRMGLGISVASFISSLFELSEGRWILFTILALVIPVYEHSHKKMRDRIFATIVGSIIIVGLFSIFTDQTARLIILMLAGYLNNFIKTYRYSTIVITISAVGSAALVTGTTEVLTMNRIYMVLIGTILAIAINKLVLPYKLENANKDLQNMYHDIIQEMLKELTRKARGLGNQHAMQTLFMVTSMVEQKMKLNNEELENHQSFAKLKEQRLLICTMYELFMWIDRHGISEHIQELVALYLPSENGAYVETDISKLRHENTSHFNDNDLVVYTMLQEIVREMHTTPA